MTRMYLLSQFFQTQPVGVDDHPVYCFHKQSTLSLPEYIQSKRVHLDYLETGDRTICGMMRNVNYLTGYAHETQIANMIVFINNSVLQLRGYKSNFDDGWWKNHGDVEGQGHTHMRSIFTGDKRDFAETLLEPESAAAHPIFTNFYELYTSITDENIRNFLLESIYYTHRINEKLIEYEKEEASG